MTTITDEDRAAAEDWLDETGGCGCDICLKQSAEFLAKVRQAAYAAGLERAADLLAEMAEATPLGHENIQRGASTYNWLRAHEAAIRAEKEKV